MRVYNDVIASRNNPVVKWASSLASKKGRDEARAFLAEGEKLTREALGANLPVTHVFFLESKYNELMLRMSSFMNKAEYSELKVYILKDTAFEKISTEKAPQGVISVIKYLDFFKDMDIIYKEDFFLSSNERALILDSVRDPGNLGAIVRSAVAFGTEHIILTSDSADLYNPKTVRSAMGSLFRVKCTVVSDILECVRQIQKNNRRVFAAELSAAAVPLSEISLNGSDVFIIGNEGHGVSSDLSMICDKSVFLPISKNTESLNASVAASIFMWEQSKNI